VRNHKHKGYERASGSLRSHPVSQKHSDIYTQRMHNLEVGRFAKAKKPTKKKQVRDRPKTKSTSIKLEFKRAVMAPVDTEGYIYLDLDECENQSGVKLTFKRGSKTVNLKIDKE
jgi:hypothetical protein